MRSVFTEVTTPLSLLRITVMRASLRVTWSSEIYCPLIIARLFDDLLNPRLLYSTLPVSVSTAVQYDAVSPLVDGIKKRSSSTVLIGIPTFTGLLQSPVLKSYCVLNTSYPPILVC